MVRKTKPRLGREAWIGAALDAVAREGTGAVRVEVLARALGVTKGSFYWHFEDRRALLDALLEHWERITTADVIDRVEAHGGDARARIAHLVAICFGASDADRIEAGIRAWAATDENASAVLARTDRRRLEYVARLLTEANVPRATARRRAKVLYLALIGEFTYRAHGGAAATRAERDEIVSLVLAPD